MTQPPTTPPQGFQPPAYGPPTQPVQQLADPTPPAKPKKSFAQTITSKPAIGILALLLGLAIGSAGRGPASTTAAAPAQTVTVTPTRSSRFRLCRSTLI